MGCAICKKETDLFELTFEPMDTEANERFTRHVCGSCWEIIATIARRISKHTVEEYKIDNKVDIDPVWNRIEDIAQRLTETRLELERKLDNMNSDFYRLNDHVSSLDSKIDRGW